ncbi:ABC transporter ATP-binding protein [Solilutibacter silvestris]|uniref:ABC transporter n=1 Tax=Solilutibacter silvestris TaxID=1645665 RepID=A0A2K1Q2D2_9GAMM|nr:ABC transporter ATP-binding protein [Lysobacter silvestris]PNS09205.1 ABC transporter [Lysobacter silvestris]
MNSTILCAENIGKAYASYRSELQRMAGWFGIRIGDPHLKWVIRNISFRLHRGEALGIVGQNGAGKSTLLKVLTGTTIATEGDVRCHGHIAALLELGLGFNQELTGRANAMHSAGLMGIPMDQLDRIVSEVEEFAEIGEYFDEPLRTYSSGMQMRLAFSVATARRPELLIVDEALAVGDTYFVHKSLQRIRGFREQGTALLFVSHDPTAVKTLCDRAILIDGGRMVLDGEPAEVLDLYNAMIAEKENRTIKTERRQAIVATESGTGEATIESVALLDSNGSPVEFIAVGDEVAIQVKVRITSRIPTLTLGYMIRDRLGQPVYGTNTAYTDQSLESLEAGDIVEYMIRFPVVFGVGSYSVSIALHSAETHLANNYQWRDYAIMFNVANVKFPSFVGLAYAPALISIEHKRAVCDA